MAWWSGSDEDYDFGDSTLTGAYDPSQYDLGDVSQYVRSIDSGFQNPGQWNFGDMQGPTLQPSSNWLTELPDFTQTQPGVGPSALEPFRMPIEAAGATGPLPTGPQPGMPVGAYDREQGGKGEEPGIMEQARKMLTDKPGRTAQGAMGLAGAGMVAAGLFGKKPQVKYPGRNVQLSPQEQAAANQMAAERQKLAGGMDARGYAGEERLRNLTNEQLEAALSGNMELARPETVRRINEMRVQLVDQLRRELGPGAFDEEGNPLATAAQNAMRNKEIEWAAILDNERNAAKQFLQTASMQRSGLYNTLELQPLNAANLELGTLSGIGAQDAALRAGINAANAGSAAADRRALLTTGGQFAGQAIAPWMWESILAGMPKRAVA